MNELLEMATRLNGYENTVKANSEGAQNESN